MPGPASLSDSRSGSTSSSGSASGSRSASGSGSRRRFPRPLALVAGGVGLGLGMLAVLFLREATLSTHHPVSPDSRTEVIVNAQARGQEPGQSLEEIVEAQIQACRLEVTSDVVGEVTYLGDGHYRAILSPAMDETNHRQFRGCLEDWLIDHVRVDVVTLRDLP